MRYCETFQARRPATRRRYFREVRCFFNWCVAAGFLDHTPFRGLRNVRLPSEVVQPFRPAELARLVAACNPATAVGRRDAAVVLLFLDTVLGIDVGTSEDGAFWLAFLRGLVARGLSGVELVTSDAHQGLREAIATVFGGASWQRCRTHFMRNLLTRVPKSAEALVATTVRTIYQQPSASDVHAQHARVVEQLGARFPEAAAMLADAAEEILAFTAFPVAH